MGRTCRQATTQIMGLMQQQYEIHGAGQEAQAADQQ